jgi:hypothetical protein
VHTPPYCVGAFGGLLGHYLRSSVALQQGAWRSASSAAPLTSWRPVGPCTSTPAAAGLRGDWLSGRPKHLRRPRTLLELDGVFAAQLLKLLRQGLLHRWNEHGKTTTQHPPFRVWPRLLPSLRPPAVDALSPPAALVRRPHHTVMVSRLFGLCGNRALLVLSAVSAGSASASERRLTANFRSSSSMCCC